MDHSRVAAVGPDRAAAEWVLRLGGSVKFTTLTHWSSDYNRLPSEPLGYLRVEAIDVSEISITDNGLEHLGTCWIQYMHIQLVASKPGFEASPLAVNVQPSQL